MVRNNGLRKDDIIVALYGIRIRNYPQYDYASDTHYTRVLEFIVWRNNQYVEVASNPPGRRFAGANFSVYARN